MVGQRVLVVGMARSGQAAAALALRLGAQVTATDLRADAPVVPGVTAIYGEHRRADFLSADLIITSPGVPPGMAHLAEARAAGVPVLGELGFAAQRIKVPIAAVTGTNGKSSTTWYLGQLSRAVGVRTFVGGNLGTPLSEAVGSNAALVVAEVSSYQLELAGDFHPKVGVILNLTPDHLARHGDMATYAAVKGRIFARMGPDDTAVLPLGDRWLAPLAARTAARVLWLGGAPGVRIEGEALIFEGTDDDGAISLEALRLLGPHNRVNAAAAALLAISIGLPRRALDLGALSPLKHRLELVHSAGGVRWIDDSKATNVEAAQIGVAGVGGAQVVLLGGQGKEGADYSALRPALSAHGRRIICFGESGPEMAAALAGLPVTLVPTMAEAVALAAREAQPGEAVLLSPAAASFDEFQNFEHRGEVFAALAREVAP